MTEVAELRNIGPRSAEWLSAVGIRTVEDLEQAGAVEAYLRAEQAFPDQVSLNLLYGLQAALMDIEWTHLPESIKRELRDSAGR